MGRKNGCKCVGHWKTRRANWRVTEDKTAKVDGEYRPSIYSEVQCRVCRRQWRSAASHLATLPRHSKRKYEKLTEQDILQLILAGHLVADKHGRIWKRKKMFDAWRPEFVLLAQTEDKRSEPPYLFVDIKHGGARKWCGVNRIVWMFVHRELIPEGYEVDHKDRVRSNNRPDNVRILTKADNHPSRHIPF